jgi:hypothetical protein
MSNTDGQHTMDTPFPDMQVYVDATWFNNIGGTSTIATDGAGLVYALLGNSAVGAFYANLALLLRTGVYATPALAQSQFGTSLSLPGPVASIPNSSDPDAMAVGYPPIIAAQMATLGNLRRGPFAKGMQIDSIDVIYTPLTLAAAVATVGLTKTVFKNGVAPVVTNLIALGANGLATTVATQPQVFNVPVTTPAMIVDSDVAQYVNVNLTAGATGTVKFYGVVVKAHFNFN